MNVFTARSNSDVTLSPPSRVFGEGLPLSLIGGLRGVSWKEMRKMRAGRLVLWRPLRLACNSGSALQLPLKKPPGSLSLCPRFKYFFFGIISKVMALVVADGRGRIHEYFAALWLSKSLHCNCVHVFETVARCLNHVCLCFGKEMALGRLCLFSRAGSKQSVRLALWRSQLLKDTRALLDIKMVTNLRTWNTPCYYHISRRLVLVIRNSVESKQKPKCSRSKCVGQ